MSMSIVQLVRVFLLAFILSEVLLASSSGLPTKLHRGRSNIRATRHNLKVRGSHRKARQIAYSPADDYGPQDLDNQDYDNQPSDSQDSDDYDNQPSDSQDSDDYGNQPSDSQDSDDYDNQPSDSQDSDDYGNQPSDSQDSDDYDKQDDANDDYAGDANGYEAEEKRDLSSTLAPSGFGNISQAINGSQFMNGSESINGSRLINGFNGSQLINGSQLFNGSQYNASLLQGLNSTLSSLGSNQSQQLNSSESVVSGLLAELPENGMKKSELFLGFLPDDGSSGGTRQTMAQLNSAIGTKAAVYGWYAQVHSGVPFDGSQLLAVIDDVKACNCVFQPAIMPIGGWEGLTSQDNSQAVAIAQVLKNFTDEGIPVWLRFAHEVNYYQSDGTYQGTASDFKAGWAAVADAVKKIAPSVKMWWTPNVSSEDDYAKYEPDDMGTVDLVGIDFYPKKLSGTDFLDAMKDFHDKYAVDGRKFAIGETGLGWSGGLDDKVKWFNEICEAKSSLPEFVSMAWFNFDKEYDYKIAGEPTLDQKFTSLIAT